VSGPVFLYLHGFASSVGSAKARAFVAWGRSRGVTVEPLALRVPSFEDLRFSAMKARVRQAIDAAGGGRARAVLIGSSLGGLTAFRVAEEDPRVAAVFAMAPAFRLAERWRATLGDEAWEKWRRDGFREVDDHLTKRPSRVHFGFVDELGHLDVGWPDVRVPCCIVHGTHDEVVDVERSRAWASNKRHVRLVEVDDGHDLVLSIDRILLEAGAFLTNFGIRDARP
jgi:uncharacterized protein